MTEQQPVIQPGSEVPAILREAFFDAVRWVGELHADQIRKSKPTVPYVSHLLGVASLVLESGGTESEAVAALLHDAVEDQDITYEEIGARYGSKVADIVRGCTDDLAVPGDEPETPNPSHDASATRGASNWLARKTKYLAHLRNETDTSILLVSAADKLHNARAIIADLRAGPDAWAPFNAPPSDQLRYYQQLRDALGDRVPEYLWRELRAAVDEIVRLTDLAIGTPAWHAAQEVRSK